MPSPDLSVIIPTYNERDNLEELISRLDRCLAGVHWEVIFVDDDSPDGTSEAITAIALSDPRVRSIRRVGRRGLSTACIEGMASSSAPFLAVMDADLQHDEKLLPEMLQRLTNGNYDLAVGSRYVEGGSLGDWSRGRRILSRVATISAQKLTRCSIADPMSGFFMLRREVFLQAIHNLSGQGFKILLDILASTPKPLRIVELPYRFGIRLAGESKLTSMVTLEYGFLLADKLFGGAFPLRFFVFSLVGGSGILVHLLLLWISFTKLQRPFFDSQVVATVSAMIYNFLLNNNITYRDRRLRGSRIPAGLIIFLLVCTIGAITNVQLSRYLFELGAPWWLAGLVGIMIVAVWNYAVTAQVVWRTPRGKR